jgi:hypothetical protein
LYFLFLDEVVRITSTNHLDIGAAEGKLPDREWLLQVLAVHDNDHLVFKKDYIPPLPTPKK